MRATGTRTLLLCMPLILTAAGAAQGQISSQQVRQRYERSTKGENIDDYVRDLQSEEASERLEAVKSLGASKDEEAVAYLIQALGDPDIRVQVKAIEMLGELRALDATPVLVQYLFLRTTDVQMKQRILASLGKIGDARAAQPIIEFLQRDLDRATRGTAIFALGDIGASQAVEPLTQIAQTDKDATVRRLAREALNKVHYHQAAQLKEVKGPSETFLPKDEPPQQ